LKQNNKIKVIKFEMKKKNLKTNDSSNEINEPILTKSQKNER